METAEHQLITETFHSRHADFYHSFWKEHGVSMPLSSSHLPTLSRKQLASCPLPRRLYTKDTEGLFVQIVRQRTLPPFLVAKTHACIDREAPATTPYDRPLVYFANAHESIEKGLWMYTRNLLPLVAEDNLAITCLAAERYRVDALLADSVSLAALLTHPTFSHWKEHVTTLLCIDAKSDARLFTHLQKTLPQARCMQILALPETGTIAYACPHSPSTSPTFHTYSHICFAQESTQKTLVITTLLPLPTPIINYDTEIPITFLHPSCGCNTPISFTLLETS